MAPPPPPPRPNHGLRPPPRTAHLNEDNAKTNHLEHIVATRNAKRVRSALFDKDAGRHSDDNDETEPGNGLSPPAKRQRVHVNGSRVKVSPLRSKYAKIVSPATARKLHGKNGVMKKDAQQTQLPPPRGLRTITNGTSVVETSPPQSAATAAVKTGVRDEQVKSESKPVKPQPTKPAAAIKNDKGQVREKRTLRSQDVGPRVKSDLALYFPAYEEMISNEPKPIELLSAESTFLIVDEPLPQDSHPQEGNPHRLEASSPLKKPSSSPSKRKSKLPPLSPAAISSKPTQFQLIPNAQRVDFTSIAKAVSNTTTDPLNSEAYLKAHRRAERQEKQLRNIEREHAQHEKSQLERILNGLRGQDWLRVMGISGVTESEKREYEPKRDMFIDEVVALIEKFRVWKDEEKRRKTKRDQALHAEEEAAAAAAAEAEKAAALEEEGEQEEQREGDEEDEGEISDGDPPDYNDVDAWAARQLQQEASFATAHSSRHRRRHSSLRDQDGQEEGSSLLDHPPPLPPPSEPLKPFVSFYAKPYLRAAAIGNHRRSARSISAFGHPLPDLIERDFELPAELLTAEAMTASARARRRIRRTSKED